MFALSLICLSAGATFASVAPQRLARQATFESMGGCPIVGGPCLPGAGLPLCR